MFIMFFNVLKFVIILQSINAYIIDPGPKVKATKGEVFPKPFQQIRFKSNYFNIDTEQFDFIPIADVECETLLGSLLRRYKNLIKTSNTLGKRGRYTETLLEQEKRTLKKRSGYLGILPCLNIYLNGTCYNDALPDLDMDEKYALEINQNASILISTSIWGVMRGIETFSQLIYFEDNMLLINATLINDKPNYKHRGFLLDTSRHFIPLYIIYQTLDAMSYNKLNVFHWHITDDQSFPYQSITFPELSEKGSYHAISRVYTQNDIKNVIEYARQRGIRVIVEFDSPGHTRSWGVSHPELLTPCYNNQSKMTGKLGPMNPILNTTYEFLQIFFKEVIEVFHDQYFHIGGDEVEFDCWSTNADIIEFMKGKDMKTFEELEAYYVKKLLTIMNNLNVKTVVWEEVFTNGIEIREDTIVQVWKNNGVDVLRKILKSGYKAIFSSCWYLDHLGSGTDWIPFYNCDPSNITDLTNDEKKLILGGEAAMWGEVVNENNLGSRVWPRASAIAERLWSNIPFNVNDVPNRMEEHTCRMNHRGIPAEPPNGPGVCL